jgi:hypothetical protein
VRSRKLRVAAICAALAAAALGLVVGAAQSPSRAPRRRAPDLHRRPPATSPGPPAASVEIGRVKRAVPASFLGVSIEWSELGAFDAHPARLARFLLLLRVGRQPLSLRIGGKSADSLYLRGVGAGAVPRGAFRPGRRYFERLARLVALAHLRLIVDLNLAARSPAMAALLARRLRRLLPRGALGAFEIGNEPDLYARGTIGLVREALTRRGPFRWARRYSRVRYAAEFRRYVRAVRAVWPGARFAGPALSSAPIGWPRALERRDPGELSLLTVHRYAYDGCSPPASRLHPTVARYLSQTSSIEFVHKLAPWVALAQRHRIPLRLTELGSAYCGGLRGVTDTFATALWGADTLFELLAAGVDGVNVHLRLRRANSALTAVRGGLRAHPLLYGMALFARALGPGARLLAAAVSAPSGVGLRAWAVRDARGVLRVLLIDESARACRVRVSPPPALPASAAWLVRLSAPSPAATSRVRLGGRFLGLDGRWRGRAAIEPVDPAGGAYTVALPADSAALLSVRPLP